MRNAMEFLGMFLNTDAIMRISKPFHIREGKIYPTMAIDT
jgi:hypothetical protein